jgi:hypothetical protein
MRRRADAAALEGARVGGAVLGGATRFRTPEGRIEVEVEVSPGEKNNRGMIPIKSGTIRVRKDGRETVVSVTGDAGC